MTGVNEEQHISAKYATELIELKCNSKPLINSLTMMAEDYIRHAPIIVQTIENHLRRVKPELKLAVLYLIDSIVKNVKKEYVQLFTHNIVSTFTQTFEQVSEKTRTQMWKLRQTWNDVFSTQKLYSIDFKCHQTDPGWPIMAAPPSTAIIHVNPKFLAGALKMAPPIPTTQAPQSVVVSTISSSLLSSTTTTTPSLPSMTVGGTTTGLSGLPDLGSSSSLNLMDPPGDITEAQMREQLLIKQKELLELQTRKLELELLHTKAQLEEKTRKQIELHTQRMETQTRQQQGTISSSSSPTSPLVNSILPTITVTPEVIITATTTTTPEESPSKRKRHAVDSSKSSSSSSSQRDRDSREKDVKDSHSSSKDRRSKVKSSSSSSSSSRRRRDSDNTSSNNIVGVVKQQGRQSSSSSSTSPVVGGSNSLTVPGTLDTTTTITLEESPSKRRKKSVESNSKSSSSSSSQREKDSKEKDIKDSHSFSSQRDKDSKEKDMKDSHSSSSSQRDKDSKEKDVKDSHSSSKDKRSKGGKSSSSSSSSSLRRRRDSENTSSIVATLSATKSSMKELKEKESRDRKRVRDDVKFRKTAVLQRNYRRRTEVSTIEDDTELIMLGSSSKKDKENHSHGGKGKSDYKKDSSKSGGSGVGDGLVRNLKGVMNDIDLRFDGLKDVDLRNEASGGMVVTTGSTSSTVDQPPMKKPRTAAGNANLIADLFGREDVDLRQPSSSSSWSQVKTRTSSISEGGSGNEIMKEDRRASQNKILSQQQQDEDIRDILINCPRPPPTISPAESVDSVRTNASCDPLGRPLLYNRLPDDPAARKRSLNTVDPVERFRSQFLERPSGGDLTDLDLSKAARQAQQEFGMGYFTKEQYAIIMRQLMQIHEVSKIRDVQQIQQRGPGPNPWTEADANGTWNQFGGPRGPTDFGQTRFPGMGSGWNQPMPGLPWGQPQAPRGPNPFEEAAAAASGPLKMNDDLLPPVNMMELDNVRKDTSGTIPIDKVLRQVRFYGDTAIVLQGMLGDEPREISFRKSEARNVFINQEREPVRCVIGKPVLIYLDRKKHMLKLGAPTRELYIDGDHYEACFDGPPLRVRVDRYLHSFKIEGPPPQVEVGKTLRYDLLAGRVNLFVDGNSVTIYLDEKPQLIDVCGFPVILRFCDGFHTVLLNGRPFPVNFGGLPMPVTVPQGRKHYLRFSGLNENTRRAMLQYIRMRDSKGGPQPTRDDGSLAPMDISPFGGPFRGRGGVGIRGRGGPPMPMVRGRAPMFNPAMLTPMGNILPPGADFPINDAFHPGVLPQFESNPNPLDVLANIMPSPVELASPNDRFRTRSTDNAYESDSSMLEERVEIKAEQNVANEPAPVIGSPLDVQDLLSRLMMAGLLPAGSDEKKPVKTEEEDKDKAPADTEASKDEVTPTDEVKMEVTPEEEPEGEKKPEPVPVPPVEVVDVTFDKLKERREKLIDLVCSGVQCGSCGLRFPSDQTVRYSQHLDWHFRQNRREKANVKKAQSRKWYYDLSDWIQFAEIEDLEERAQSLFESQDADMDGDERSPGTVLNPDLYTVLSAEHDGAVCPQCNEGFESFFDEDKEEWRLRDAFLAENVEEGTMKLYHPICHQDYTACLQGKSMLTKAEETPAELPPPSVKPPDDEDEVLILKEGKPEVEVMDIAIEEDDNKDTLEENTSPLDSSTATLVVSPPTEIHLIDDEPNDSIIEKDSDEQNETICINDDENGVDVSINNKKETTATTTDSQQQNNVDSSSISHNNNSNSTNIQVDDTSIITLSGSGDGDALSKDNLNDNTIVTSINLSSSTNTNNNSSNISVSVLSSIGSGGKGDAPGSPTLVMIDDDTSDGGLFASIPGITDKSVFNIALSSGGGGVSSGEKESPYKPIIYESMKFDVPTPVIKTEPVDPDEDLQNEDILSLDDIIKANMTDEAQDGMESSVGQPGSVPAEVVVPDVPPTAVDIDLTGEDDDVSNDESNLVAGSAALDGNFLFETSAAVSVLPKAVIVSIDAASLKPRNTDSKPRLSGRKLVNCPPKVSGKEVSGLCTIC